MTSRESLSDWGVCKHRHVGRPVHYYDCVKFPSRRAASTGEAMEVDEFPAQEAALDNEVGALAYPSRDLIHIFVLATENEPHRDFHFLLLAESCMRDA